jgi:hypothetical protein
MLAPIPVTRLPRRKKVLPSVAKTANPLLLSEAGGNHAAGHDIAQARLTGRRRGVVLAGAADLQDFGGGDTLGIGQVAFHDHRPA